MVQTDIESYRARSIMQTVEAKVETPTQTTASEESDDRKPIRSQSKKQPRKKN